MYKQGFLLLLVIAIQCNIFAQSDSISREDYTLKSDINFTSADSLFRLNEFESAIRFYKKALETSKSLVDTMNTYNYIGLAYHFLEKNDSSKSYFIPISIIDPGSFKKEISTILVTRSLFVLNTIALKEQEYLKSVDYLTKAISHLDNASINKYETINYKIDLAAAYYFLGRIDKAIDIALSAKSRLQLIDLSERSKKILEAKIYGGLGVYYDEIGESERALVNYKLSLGDQDYFNENYNEDVVQKYINISQKYLEVGEADSCIHYNNLAIRIVEQGKGNQVNSKRGIYLSDLFFLKGKVYFQKNDQKGALDFLNQSLKEAENYLQPYDERYNPTLIELAKIYIQNNNFIEAEKYAKRALLNSRISYSRSDNFARPNEYNFLAEIYQQKNDHVKSFEYIDSALLVNTSINSTNETAYIENDQTLYSIRIILKNGTTATGWVTPTNNCPHFNYQCVTVEAIVDYADCGPEPYKKTVILLRC